MLDRIKDLLKQDPFILFRLIVTNGQSYEVISPYMLALGETRMTYSSPKSDRQADVRLGQLVSVETLEPHGV
jgi:hypothetical protein